MGIIQKILKADSYYRPVTLRFKKGSGHHTCLGWVFSLLMGVILITASYFFSRDIIERTNPETIQMTMNDLNPADIVFTQSTLPMTFGLMEFIKWNHWIDERIYYIDIKRVKITKVLNQTTGNFDQHMEVKVNKLNPCNRQKNFNKLQEIDQYVKILDLENLYCFDYDQYEPVVGGNLDFTQHYNQFTVSVKECSNQTLRNDSYVCAPKEEIDLKLKKGFVYFYYTDYMVDIGNFTNSFQPYMNTFWTYSSFQSPRAIVTKFKHSIVDSDIGMILTDVSNTTSPVFDSTREMSAILDPGEFVRFTFVPPFFKDYRMRIYQKIQKAFAEIGGFIKICSVIIIILITTYIEIDYYHQFINEIFSYREIKEDPIYKEKVKLKYQKIKKLWKEKQKKVMNLDDQKVLSKKLFQLINDEETLPLNKVEQFLFFLGGVNDRKRELFEASQAKIEEKIDIVFIINKLMQIDKLKYLLLTQEQRCLFDFIPKPNMNQKTLECPESFKYDSILQSKASKEEVCFEAYFSYQTLQEQEANFKHPLDNNVMRILDDKTRILFQFLYQYDQNSKQLDPQSYQTQPQRNKDANIDSLQNFRQQQIQEC